MQRNRINVGENGLLVKEQIWLLWTIQYAKATQEPTPNRRTTTFSSRLQSRLHDSRKNGWKLALRSPTCHRSQASSIYDSIAVMRQNSSFDGGAVAGRADDNGIQLRPGFGGDLGGRAYVANYLVLMGEECGEHPRANVASNAQQEYFHGD